MAGELAPLMLAQLRLASVTVGVPTMLKRQGEEFRSVLTVKKHLPDKSIVLVMFHRQFK